ncbi:MAG: hypothetical protein HYZ39_16290 [Mycolicibacterium cosmeticum]|nr:hypothetical protein [Mycolicibacterium cosmeticum]
MPDTAPAPRPAIPATCEARPTIGGYVIPWVNVQLADGGVDFRAQHESRSQRCWREGLCQVCAKPITHPIVLLGGPGHLAALQFDEPPLHPECAVYVSHACPMVAGRLDRFADRDTITNGHRGGTCPDPGCKCGGWVPTAGAAEPVPGKPAHDWYAVYVSDYACAVTAERPNRIHSGLVDPVHVLAVRHVSTPGVGRTWTRTSVPVVPNPTVAS